MTFIYPVVVTKHDDGSYTGEFPDLKMCYCRGGSLQDCLDDAQQAAYNWIELELTEDDPQMPHVTDIADLTLDKNQEARNIKVHFRMMEGWDE